MFERKIFYNIACFDILNRIFFYLNKISRIKKVYREDRLKIFLDFWKDVEIKKLHI